MIMSLRNQRRDVQLMNEQLTAIVHAVVADGVRDNRNINGSIDTAASDGVSSSDTDANGYADVAATNAGSECCCDCGAECRCDEACGCRTPVVLDAVGLGSTLLSGPPYIRTRSTPLSPPHTPSQHFKRRLELCDGGE